MILVQDHGEHPLVEELYVKANNNERMDGRVDDGWIDEWMDR